MIDVEKLKVKLEEKAKERTWADQFGEDTIIDDFAGGNVDDAYYGGARDGEIEYARRLLEEFFGE